jgi:chromate transporter
MKSLKQLAWVFLKIGIIGFGGPAAHLALIEQEIVTNRKWLSREKLLQLVGITNLIPGPNSTEIAMQIGFIQAGWPGLFLAGSCFIIPAVLTTAVLAWFYVTYGALPEVSPFLMGIKPAVLGIIVSASIRFGKTAFRNWKLILIGIIVFVAALVGWNEVLVLLGSGILGGLWIWSHSRKRTSEGKPPFLSFIFTSSMFITSGVGSSASSISVIPMVLLFLKVGSVLYGTGYVLIAFLQGELVDTRGWLTQQQLLDAIAVGQFTPGPILSTATFIGYQLLGPAGAIFATVAIFLPSFVFVAILSPFLKKIEQWHFASHFLQAVTAGSVSLIAAVSVQIGLGNITNLQAAVIALLSLIGNYHWNINPGWIIAFSSLAGWLIL